MSSVSLVLAGFHIVQIVSCFAFYFPKMVCASTIGSLFAKS